MRKNLGELTCTAEVLIPAQDQVTCTATSAAAVQACWRGMQEAAGVQEKLGELTDAMHQWTLYTVVRTT